MLIVVLLAFVGVRFSLLVEVDLVVDVNLDVHLDVYVDIHVGVHVDVVGGVCPCDVDVGGLVDTIVSVSARSCDHGVVGVGVDIVVDVVVWCRR